MQTSLGELRTLIKEAMMAKTSLLNVLASAAKQLTFYKPDEIKKMVPPGAEQAVIDTAVMLAPADVGPWEVFNHLGRKKRALDQKLMADVDRLEVAPSAQPYLDDLKARLQGGFKQSQPALAELQAFCKAVAGVTTTLRTLDNVVNNPHSGTATRKHDDQDRELARSVLGQFGLTPGFDR